MLKRFLENCKRPEGRFGKMVVGAMNNGHAPVSKWALGVFPVTDGEQVLDVGCGGGGNLARILQSCPQSRADGIDYSGASVECSRKTTRKYSTRCSILQGDVMRLPYSGESSDRVVSFESIYFWPDPVKGLAEIRRVLKPSGKVVIVCEMTDPEKGAFWMKRCEGMKIYTAAELRSFLEAAGFSGIKCETAHTVWCALQGVKEN